KMVEQAGAKALAVHCRTRSQAHEGEADWTWLEKIKKAINIPLFGNGDVTTPEDAKEMFDLGCDGVMIGRGAIINPWIFQQSKHYVQTGELLPPPSLKEKVELCIEHLKLAVHLKGTHAAILPFRKHYAGYFKGIPNVSQLRCDLMQLNELNQVVDRLYQFLESNSQHVLLAGKI
ncbi:MAG: tRNA-dihydrouridine synthase, partial [Candidatus Omnitrophota bacterium]|nr:tRNA-dihydrouridine synthase [Candidatus Omnitrophota bacterium]